MSRARLLPLASADRLLGLKTSRTTPPYLPTSKNAPLASSSPRRLIPLFVDGNHGTERLMQ
ncbi:hypothetical protein DL93DRAFT_2085005 [Clavulina sp. PMI_390]|nr:hypothetical protein DL93DRAFT_2085005 [Clavulina sp. PMI_390]